MMQGFIEQHVEDSLHRIQVSTRPEAWISVRSEADLRREARLLDARVEGGERLPLGGLVFAVKDNIDVAGIPTTAAHPSFLHIPERSASVVDLLLAAGAICVGKTNMDQFATGLVGTRSPFGGVRHATDEALISGGSSSGSAVVVATGEVDFSLGTDTAGSGRVPAAFNGIVGLKPSLGLVASDGLLPAAKPYDSISVFARELPLAAKVFQSMISDPADASLLSAPLAAPVSPTLAVPNQEGLSPLCPEAAEVFQEAKERLAAVGTGFVEIEMDPFFELAALLYDSALVAERTAAFGSAVNADDKAWDPSVIAVVRQGMQYSAVDFLEAREQMERTRQRCLQVLEGTTGLLIPTVAVHPSIAEVQVDPDRLNRQLGTFTNFVNLLGFAAVAVPVPHAGSRRFGVTVATPHGHDAVGLDIASRLLEETWEIRSDLGHAIVVFGAHLRGQPANGDLERLGARYIEDVSLAANYRMVRLNTPPPKPGIEFGPNPSSEVQGELWRIPSANLSEFIHTLTEPMTLGPVTLNDGRIVTGFGFRGGGASYSDISRFHRWDVYLASLD